MTVYVDSMNALYGRLKLSHMIADSDDELHAMADRIGLNRRWHQAPPIASSSHYDISMSKRALAVAAGAVEITWRECSLMTMVRRRDPGAPLMSPDKARRLLSEGKIAEAVSGTTSDLF